MLKLMVMLGDGQSGCGSENLVNYPLVLTASCFVRQAQIMFPS